MKEEVCVKNISGYSTVESCSMVPRQVCTVTRKPTKKSTPSEHCTRVPREFCFPRGSSCNIVKSEKECREQVRVEVIEVPTEKCSVQPIPRFPKYANEYFIFTRFCLDAGRKQKFSQSLIKLRSVWMFPGKFVMKQENNQGKF